MKLQVSLSLSLNFFLPSCYLSISHFPLSFTPTHAPFLFLCVCVYVSLSLFIVELSLSTSFHSQGSCTFLAITAALPIAQLFFFHVLLVKKVKPQTTFRLNNIFFNCCIWELHILGPYGNITFYAIYILLQHYVLWLMYICMVEDQHLRLHNISGNFNFIATIFHMVHGYFRGRESAFMITSNFLQSTLDHQIIYNG